MFLYYDKLGRKVGEPPQAHFFTDIALLVCDGPLGWLTRQDHLNFVQTNI